MKVPEDHCSDPRVRYENYIYFPGLLDRGRFNVKSGDFIYMARKSWNFPENEGNSNFFVL